MKISVTYRSLKKKKNLKDQKLINHTIIIPVCKGVWYFTVDFKKRFEINSWGNDGEYDEQTYFDLGENKFTIVTIDATEEKIHISVYAKQSKTSYYGIAINRKLIDKAWDKHEGGKS